VTSELRLAYEAAGAGWGDGPSAVYGRLARPLLHAVEHVAGRHALDVGTGAGFVARELTRRGAHVVATDLAHSMLRAGSDQRPPGVVGDVRVLPFVDEAFDLVTAAFVLNHLADPAEGLRELSRVTRPNGVLLATTFDGLPPHPAKEVVDAVAARFGFVRPAWYDEMRRDSSNASSQSVLYDAARSSGWTSVTVDRSEVRVDLSARQLAGWRLGMAHLAGFVASLPEDQREQLAHDCADALGHVEPLVLPVLLLRATRAVPAA
jgi:SAM-dependent methyltransferase